MSRKIEQLDILTDDQFQDMNEMDRILRSRR